MAKVLLMTFLTETSTNASITLSNINPHITNSQVSAAMDTIISKNIFTASGGDLKKKYSAQVVDTNIEKLIV